MSRNLAVSAFAEVASKFITFALIIVAARALDEADFGAFASSVAFAILLTSVAQWGFDTVLEREGSAHPDQLPRLVATNLWWRTLIAIPLFVAAGSLQWFTRPTPESAITLVLVLIATLVDSYSEVGRSAATARRDQGGVASAQVLQRLTAALFGIAALAAGAGLVGMASGYLAGSLVGAVAVLAATRRLSIGWQPLSVTRSELRQMWRWALSPGVAAMCYFLVLRLGVVLLGWWKGDATLAGFTVSFRLIETVLFASWAMRRAAFPIMSAATERADVRASLEQGIGAVAVVYVPFAAVLLVNTPTVLNTIFGAPYGTTAVTTMRWLAIVPLIYGVAHLSAYALLARNQGSRLLVGAAVGAATTVVASVVLIPGYGASGAAAALVVGLVVTTAAQIFLLRQAIGAVRIVAPMATPVLIAALLSALLLVAPLPVVLEIVVFGLAYAVAWFLVARRTESDPASAYALIRRHPVPT